GRQAGDRLVVGTDAAVSEVAGADVVQPGASGVQPPLCGLVRVVDTAADGGNSTILVLVGESCDHRGAGGGDADRCRAGGDIEFGELLAVRRERPAPR